jgi:hypothetical protein
LPNSPDLPRTKKIKMTVPDTEEVVPQVEVPPIIHLVTPSPTSTNTFANLVYPVMHICPNFDCKMNFQTWAELMRHTLDYHHGDESTDLLNRLSIPRISTPILTLSDSPTAAMPRSQSISEPVALVHAPDRALVFGPEPFYPTWSATSLESAAPSQVEMRSVVGCIERDLEDLLQKYDDSFHANVSLFLDSHVNPHEDPVDRHNGEEERQRLSQIQNIDDGEMDVLDYGDLGFDKPERNNANPAENEERAMALAPSIHQPFIAPPLSGQLQQNRSKSCQHCKRPFTHPGALRYLNSVPCTRTADNFWQKTYESAYKTHQLRRPRLQVQLRNI